MSPTIISYYKLKKIASLSLKNALRLHFDSILLFKNKSYPSAYQLSVLALEEFGKAKAVEHYVWSSETNDNVVDPEFEMEFIEKLYLHPWKQGAAILRERFDFSPKFVSFVESRGLEGKKQRATYVGLKRLRKGIDLAGNISSPDFIKKIDAQQQISLLNEIIKEISLLKDIQGFYFSIDIVDKILTSELHNSLLLWKHRSGLKSKKFYNDWIKNR